MPIYLIKCDCGYVTEIYLHNVSAIDYVKCRKCGAVGNFSRLPTTPPCVSQALIVLMMETIIMGVKSMKKCKGCVYWNDMQRFVHGDAVVWSGNEAHPCMTCKRYPKIRQVQFDNYKKGRFCSKDDT